MAVSADSIDVLTLLSGQQIKISDKVVFNQPTLEEVVQFGEKQYYKVLADMTAIPSDIKSVLWDNGIDWMEFDDMELFYAFVRSIPTKYTSIFFPGIDFSKFILIKSDDGKLLMYNKFDDVKIDFYAFKKMQDCLCKSHGLVKKVEKAANKITKQILIDEDRQKRKSEDNKEFQSNLSGLISSLVNYSGFKYDYSAVWNLTMFQFMDAVRRARVIDSTNHLMNGIYAGNVDVRKISSNKMNWMRDIGSED